MRCDICGTSFTDWDKHAHSQRHQQNCLAVQRGPNSHTASQYGQVGHDPTDRDSIQREPIVHGTIHGGAASQDPTSATHGSIHIPIAEGPLCRIVNHHVPAYQEPRWDTLLNRSSGPLTHIISAFQSLPRQEQSTTPGHGVPSTFPAQECWVQRPESADLFLDALSRTFYEKETSIYSRQNPTPISQPKLAVVIRQLYQPTEHEAFFAINIPGGAKVKIPEREGAHHQQSSVGTTSNLTPAFSYVAPHIDGGDNVLALLYPVETHTAIKIWAVFPPTEHNLGVHKNSYVGRDLFVHPFPSESGYERGLVIVQSEKDAMLLPPGWIHATFTLYGCITTGVQYASRASLESTARILRMDALGLQNPSPEPFFRAIELAIALGMHDEAVKELCCTLPSVRVQCTLPDLVAGLKCSCNKSWRSHLRR